ncbi:dehydrogenase/reductase-like protein [Leptotrombidium deliense]|uniref:Dehydrogenase/reductase-like protein n=1 Tax=Leptotrombidium deliense TaxID=299467 RepID=A0A443SAS8_9ACAR|nr:dehydrogenase/reductase-like protein [Leptotrombidium deliense]
MDFEGKVVIVTGSSSGIGEEIAVSFAKKGAKIVLNGRNQERLQKVFDKCVHSSPTHSKPLMVIADLSVDGDLKRLLDTAISEFGKLDILINNAGESYFAPVDDPEIIDAFDKSVKNNLRPLLVLSNLAIPHLVETKGCIVNISSCMSQKPEPYMLTLSATDSSKEMITRSMALELGPKGVRVNCVRPGFIKTPAYEKSGYVFEDMEFLKKQPIQKHGGPEDVANAVLFLASPESAFITGTCIQVDGGVTDA